MSTAGFDCGATRRVRLTTRRNSNTLARASTTSGVCVYTTMPSVTAVEHAVCSFAIF